LKPKIITIDGPAGAGKSSLAREIAKRFGYLHLDSGAVYRAIGVACKDRSVDLENQEEILKCASKLQIELKKNGKVLVNGEDLTQKVRSLEGGRLASKVAKFPKVRDLVVKILRELAKDKEIVIDGRDAGTYIFPQAELKIYLTASLEERAKRRLQELLSKGYKASYEEVLEEVKKRDESDRNREFAPLTIPEGAVVIDTTNKSFEEVVQEVEKLVKDC